MQNRFDKGSIAMCVTVGLLGFVAQARTFEFKRLNSTGLCDNVSYSWGSRRLWYSIKVGGASKVDDMSEVLKPFRERVTGSKVLSNGGNPLTEEKLRELMGRR